MTGWKGRRKREGEGGMKERERRREGGRKWGGGGGGEEIEKSRGYLLNYSEPSINFIFAAVAVVKVCVCVCVRGGVQNNSIDTEAKQCTSTVCTRQPNLIRQ